MPLYHTMKLPLILHTRILILKLVFYFNILHVNITTAKKILFQNYTWNGIMVK